MAISLHNDLRDDRGDAIIAFAGSGALLRVYTAAYGALLYECECDTVLATMSGGTGTFNPIADSDPAVGAGTAAIARLYKSDGTTIVMAGLTVGTSGTNIIITNAVIAVNDVVVTTGGTWTEGNP